MRRPLVVPVLAGISLLAPAAAAASGAQGVSAETPGAREVVLVTNAEGGTVSIVDARTFRVLRELDVLPDGPDAEPGDDDPAQALAGQRLVEAAGGNNYAQDQDVSPDGRVLYVSRGHRGDVAAFDLATGELLWKVSIPGLRADHMTLSADGRRLFVSALTEDEVEVIDTGRRAITASFAAGQWPHDNHLSDDGVRLYNGSIGNVVAPEGARHAGGPPYRLTVVDASTLAPLDSHVFDRGIRPYSITHDERRMYAQLSEFHGVIEYGLPERQVLRSRELPVDPGVTEDDYDFEAPHHGLAMTPDERTLCLAGRASDYVALVSTGTMEPTAIIEVDDAPGWATIGPDGSHCFVPNTRADTLSVISLAARREVARVRMGDGPKQIEAARLPDAVVCTAADVPGCTPALRLSQRCVRGRRLRVRLTGETDRVRSVSFRIGALRAADARAPFARTLSRAAVARRRGRRVRAVAELTGGVPARVKRSALFRGC
jgi:DNA-binding beta-propeller fold protein YncE